MPSNALNRKSGSEMRLIFACLTAFALGTPALAEPVIVLGDTPYKTFGKRVSVSSVVRLATITGDRPRMSATRAYLPAGKILLVGRGGLCHKKSLDLWCFAVTQDGLPVFVRADSKGYFKAGENVVFVHTGGSAALFAYPRAFDLPAFA